ncbi:hypothetical protein [Paraburkholderia rhizosphaerae]|uniref:hypothetical protein n=1 Tax=Paraburkholderia rhizosphaerae TaxID=480658 RepID=UPI001416FCF0|nr:hypothetical protein [Paraburkholderia rhizosphaerae]
MSRKLAAIAPVKPALPPAFFFASQSFFEYSNRRFALYIADTGFRTLQATQRKHATPSMDESDLIAGIACIALPHQTETSPWQA